MKMQVRRCGGQPRSFVCGSRGVRVSRLSAAAASSLARSYHGRLVCLGTDLLDLEAQGQHGAACPLDRRARLHSHRLRLQHRLMLRRRRRPATRRRRHRRKSQLLNGERTASNSNPNKPTTRTIALSYPQSYP